MTLSVGVDIGVLSGLRKGMWKCVCTLLGLCVMAAACLFFDSSGVLAQENTTTRSKLRLDIASDHVDITTGFDGARIYVYGQKQGDGDIVIVVKGPQAPMVVRSKEKVLGMWVNRTNVKFQGVFTYYDYAANVALNNITDYDILQHHDIGIDYFHFDTQNKDLAQDRQTRFHEALIRVKQGEGLYPLKPQHIIFINENFFKSEFVLPSNVPTGEYVVEGYLFQGGAVSDVARVNFRVAQTGKSAEIYKFAKRQSLLYGITAVMIAAALGWAANSLLRN